MELKADLPKRKHPRLDNYDYSSAGAYFITICTQNRRCLLSRIVERKQTDFPRAVGRTAVFNDGIHQIGDPDPVGRGLAPAEKIGVMKYSPFGEIAEEQLLLLENRYPFLSVDKYVIMPNHIHVILVLHGNGEARPSITDIVCTYKSLTVRECNKIGNCEKIFQTSFYEHIIREREDYDQIVKYIYNNPLQWSDDELYSTT